MVRALVFLASTLISAAASAGTQPSDVVAAEAPQALRDLLEPPQCPLASPCTGSGRCGGVASPIRFVNLFSGEILLEEDDLRIAGRGLDFIWTRTYRSRASPQTPLGAGWDFSYNVFLVESGVDYLLHDGTGRVDAFVAQGPGVWAQDEFFRELRSQGDGSFIMEFADTGEWAFHAFDGGPRAGKLERISDRNANTLLLSYDALGRLATVTDTLGRNIVIAYNGAGQMVSVTDFLGRSVRYRYYGPGAPGGAAGDLQSATSPRVVGTPNGNDFPSGKTTRYTSSKGFANDALNHNLLTVTDPKGQTWLAVTYAATQNPQAIAFDHAARIQWGGPSDLIALTYVAQTPGPGNGQSVVKAIVNDRIGNVGEYSYDILNRMVLERRFTGRAVPGVPVTDSSNRPTGKLRSSDPDFFETRFEYNVDSLVARGIYPNGDERIFIHEVDLDPQAARRARGNLREQHMLAGPLGGDQSSHDEYFEYAPGFGGCCDTSFITQEVDARGNVTSHLYDERGNRLQTIHAIPSIVENWEYNQFGQLAAHVWPDNGSGYWERDEYRYYANGTQRGYRREQLLDAGGLGLRTRYEYNAVGALTRAFDERGADSMYVVNALDQTVRKLSRETTAGNGVRIARDYYYDANDNIVRAVIENRDENGELRDNTHFTRSWDYDFLNQTLRETTEVASGHDIATEYEYDAHRNLVLRRFGEAVNGNQPANVVRLVPDERNLRFQEIRGEGAPEQSTTEYDYDLNGHAVRVSRGLEDNPRVTTYGYDGFGRRVRTVDPMGNETLVNFDAIGNLTHQRVLGELDDVAGGTANVRLFEAEWTYDALQRKTRQDIAHFDPATQVPIGDGVSRTTYEWSEHSKPTRVTDDNGNATTTTYDGANRRSVVTDAKGDTVAVAYDVNSNVVRVTETEKSDLGTGDRVFVTDLAYDGLDRRVKRIDNLGHEETSFLDSRGLPGKRVDERGNTTFFTYDGADRLVERRHVLTDTGTGGGIVIGSITLLTEWDDSSRRTSATDDGGNVTRWEYDALGRRVQETLADGRTTSWTYDVHDDPVEWATPDGNAVQDSYDASHRLVDRSVALAPGFGGTTFEAYRYDGSARRVRIQDDDSLVTMAYDSLSNLVRETLNGHTTACSYDGLGNELQCSYPGGRPVAYGYGPLNLLRTVTAESALASYDYEGRRVVRRTYPRPNAVNAIRSTYTYDGDRRITRATHVRDPDGAATLLEDRSLAWDAAGNKIARDNLVQDGWLHDYEYDSVDRLVRTIRTEPGMGPETIDYGLDGANNRLQVTGGQNPGAYTYAPALPEPADRQMNQATTTPFDTRLYDAAGNLVRTSGADPADNLSYDYANRLITYTDGATGRTVQFTYDALGRRMSLRPQGGTETRFYYHGSKVIEEQSAAGATLATYVFGPRTDEVIQMKRGSALSYYLEDDQQSVMSLDNGAGTIRERYEYEDYGWVVFLTPPMANNPWLFTGQRFDAATGLYFFKRRYMDPRIGRFVTRDPLGTWSDPSMLGNSTAYVGNNPWSRVDPSGLDWERSEYCEETEDTLLTRFDSCSSSDRRGELEQRLCDAYAAAETAHGDANDARNGTAESCEEEDLEEWFHSTDSNLSDSQCEDIHDVMHDVYYRFQDHRIEFECEDSSNNTCEDGANAFVNGWDNNIHLCNRYWTSGFDDQDQSAIIYHEATHEWGGTDDVDYFGAGACDSTGLSTSELINNADTYEEYLEDIHMGTKGTCSSGTVCD